MSSVTKNALQTYQPLMPKLRYVHFIKLGSQLDQSCTNPEFTFTNHRKAGFISTLHHATSLLRQKWCQVPLFQRALPMSHIQAGKSPATGWAQEASDGSHPDPKITSTTKMLVLCPRRTFCLPDLQIHRNFQHVSVSLGISQLQLIMLVRHKRNHNQAHD